MKSKYLHQLIILTGFFGLPQMVAGQLVIGQGSLFAVDRGEMAASCNFINESAQANLSSINFTITGGDQLLHTDYPVTVKTLTVNGDGEKVIQGEWSVTGKLLLVKGLVVPAGNRQGTFIYTGDHSLIGHPDSYIKGLFFSKGNGNRFYPVGNDTGYYPAVLTSGQSLVGLEVIEADPALLIPPGVPDLLSIFGQRYWRLVNEDNNQVNALIGLSLRDTESFTALSSSDPFGLAIVEANQTGESVRNIGQNTTDASFVFSSLSISGYDNVYTIGKTVEVRVKIRNLVTQNNDSENDMLFIEYIDAYPDNKVTLMDRWGTVIKEWKNFSNDSPQDDYAALPAGHYICMLEYKTDNGIQKLSQMVTILK